MKPPPGSGRLPLRTEAVDDARPHPRRRSWPPGRCSAPRTEDAGTTSTPLTSRSYSWPTAASAESRTRSRWPRPDEALPPPVVPGRPHLTLAPASPAGTAPHSPTSAPPLGLLPTPWASGLSKASRCALGRGAAAATPLHPGRDRPGRELTPSGPALDLRPRWTPSSPPPRPARAPTVDGPCRSASARVDRFATAATTTAPASGPPATAGCVTATPPACPGRWPAPGRRWTASTRSSRR